MIIKIKNLHLYTIIGLNAPERVKKQEVVINLEIEIPGENAAASDEVNDTVDYKKLKNDILERGEKTDFKLLEKLASFVLDITMQNPKISRATVEIDKPGALTSADSVSVTLSRKRENTQ
jgi:dihydroneopterin aldolase